MADMEVDTRSRTDIRVPGYLGRILDRDEMPVGTCFQVAENVLVTASHVLDAVEAAVQGATVKVDALNESLGPTQAHVIRVDDLHDVAILRRDSPLPDSV